MKVTGTASSSPWYTGIRFPFMFVFYKYHWTFSWFAAAISAQPAIWHCAALLAIVFLLIHAVEGDFVVLPISRNHREVCVHGLENHDVFALPWHGRSGLDKVFLGYTYTSTEHLSWKHAHRKESTSTRTRNTQNLRFQDIACIIFAPFALALKWLPPLSHYTRVLSMHQGT